MATQSLQRNALTAFRQYGVLIDNVLQWILALYQASAATLFLASLYVGVIWMQQPFLGAFYEHTLVFNGTGQSGSPEWALFEQVAVGDQLVAIDDVPVRNSQEIHAILSRRAPGDNVNLTVRAVTGEQRVINVVLRPFPPRSRAVYFFIPMALSAAFLAASLWIFGLRRNEPAGRAFSLFTSSLAIVTGTYFNLVTTHEFTVLWTLACALAGGALFELALVFPMEPRLIVNRPYLRWLSVLVALGLWAFALPSLFNLQDPTLYIARWQHIYAFMALSVLLYIALNVVYALRASSPVVKTQARTILFGTLFAFAPVFIWLIIGALQPLNFSPYLFLPVAAFPLTIGYTILRFRFMRADEWLRRGVAYALLTGLIALGYAALTLGAGWMLGENLPANNPYLAGFFLLLIAMALEPLRARMQTLTDAMFFRGERAFAERLEDFSRRLTTALDLNSIGVIIREQLASTLVPDKAHVYTYDALNDFYSALPGEDRRPTSDVRFTATSPLAQYFQNERLPLYLDNIEALPVSLQPEQARLTLLGARLFVALPGKEKPNGWLALGSRLSGQPYTPRDLRFLENLCDQASVAIERVQTVANLERRVHEMNALTRVSQGVNVTPTFDDALELIYAQTAQTIPSAHFHITLSEEGSPYYYYAFCVENNERIHENENQRFAANIGLSPEVIIRSRPIITQDYIRECQARNFTPVLGNVYAWMGVPLNAGPKSIGALSVGSADPATIYTRGQLDLLQAIADQTAGAIVKARLLEETEQRARQLSTLNEITRQLTSTLELQPLLQNILENAVGILNCEAGSLFLVDEQTGELVFKVTVGPVAANLIGQRLPPGTGIVGRAVQMRQPLIENKELKEQTAHFGGIDQQTGFVSRNLMAVPLQVKDRVIGVIEVINRRDGLPFVEEDQTLLTAFAGQAAVAIENARLYELTDQELAARVEELSVMQRIDRELNASLEMDRAMRITLEWALRQSNMEAGLIGMLHESKLQVMAHQGFDEKTAALFEQPLEANFPAMKLSVESGQPQRVSVTAVKEKLLASAHTQISIPIRRETEVIGLLHLESASDALVDVAFLTRLTDHAAIAISNAQLYGEVRRANYAKSEFVSFVAHELKNPMTSIKGYTDLMAGGAVGPINEMQANFLNTIKANVIRMDTLVSDLNDISKIEAGRLSLTYKPADVPTLIDDTVRSLKKQIEDKKQTLVLKLAENLPNIWADRVRVVQTLVNLLSNSHKYTPEGGTLEVGAEESPNHWDPNGAPRVVHIWVKDNGVGMTPEDQKKVFQQYFRTEYSKEMAAGTGLGLNITKRLVEMQGGKIWFESVFKGGTTFHITVPVAEE